MTNELESLEKHFRTGVSIDDERPTPAWIPSPAQIQEFSAIVRSGWTADEKLRRLRPDLRPTYRLADGRTDDIAASNYENHHLNGENLRATHTS